MNDEKYLRVSEIAKYQKSKTGLIMFILIFLLLIIISGIYFSLTKF